MATRFSGDQSGAAEMGAPKKPRPKHNTVKYTPAASAGNFAQRMAAARAAKRKGR